MNNDIKSSLNQGVENMILSHEFNTDAMGANCSVHCIHSARQKSFKLFLLKCPSYSGWYFVVMQYRARGKIYQENTLPIKPAIADFRKG